VAVYNNEVTSYYGAAVIGDYTPDPTPTPTVSPTPTPSPTVSSTVSPTPTKTPEALLVQSEQGEGAELGSRAPSLLVAVKYPAEDTGLPDSSNLIS
jgi:hypothetical protein